MLLCCCCFVFVFIHDFITLVTVSGTCLSDTPSSVTAGPTVTRCFFGVGPRATWAGKFRVRHERGDTCNTDELGHLSLLCTAIPASCCLHTTQPRIKSMTLSLFGSLRSACRSKPVLRRPVSLICWSVALHHRNRRLIRDGSPGRPPRLITQLLSSEFL